MALIYRAHFAFAKTPRISSKGVNTSAVFGFTNTILEVIQKEKPDYLGVAFDTSAPTFRHIEYTPYKAQREKQPEDITIAIPYVKQLVEAMDIPLLILDQNLDASYVLLMHPSMFYAILLLQDVPNFQVFFRQQYGLEMQLLLWLLVLPNWVLHRRIWLQHLQNYHL